MRAPLILLAACSMTLLSAGPAAATWGPLASPNPYLGPVGTSTMHGDAGSSDATPLAGPGVGAVPVSAYPLASACPTLLEGSDNLVVALCTAIAGQAPTVHLIDPASPGPLGHSLASLQLTKGSLLGGVYAYLDNDDRLVVVDGADRLLRVGHVRDASGRWRLESEQVADLSAVIPVGDNVTGLVPDWSGNIWFATGKGVVGLVAPSGAAVTVSLPADEQVANSISAAPSGRIAVATTHALYELRADGSGRPEVLWRAAYDRGSARKPGQLSWGTGSTPTYFGPNTGADYLTIVDNADGQVNALVFRSGSGQSVCSQPVLTKGGAGSENSPIGLGRSLFVASTYGYPYPAVPEGAGPAAPPTAAFTGGMTRVDVDDDGCHTVWENTVRSAAVPHLSTADGAVYTVTRLGPDTTTPLDGYAFTVVDPDTGSVTASHPLPGTLVDDPLQTSPLLTHGGRVLQGTVTGILRVG
ncbi:hypothetical protein DFR70_10631 [Nocardia tenerifensis]|uniref:Uncharacterized protein n=1 Tax=Nocardia tenerifensis TaxID=228006 RepID=A0A318JZP8_9NOCA|nr:hypothetical protein [Nocardia tenerifensis]PXX62978.1 hypothetical protein DFR70_10631 [Nocardia tenerifensis]